MMLIWKVPMNPALNTQNCSRYSELFRGQEDENIFDFINDSQLYNLQVFAGGGVCVWNLTSTLAGIGAENWYMIGFSPFFQFFFIGK